jgi:hypothetical protein
MQEEEEAEDKMDADTMAQIGMIRDKPENQEGADEEEEMVRRRSLRKKKSLRTKRTLMSKLRQA